MRALRSLQVRIGLSISLVIMLVWLGISLVVADFVVDYLIGQDFFVPAEMYAQGLPTWVPEWAIILGAILLLVFVMQILLWFGFMLVSPEGHRKTGRPSMYSRNPDPLDQDRFYR